MDDCGFWINAYCFTTAYKPGTRNALERMEIKFRSRTIVLLNLLFRKYFSTKVFIWLSKAQAWRPFSMRGTQPGEFTSGAPAGGSVTFAGASLIRFAGGKIVEAWEYVNVLPGPG